LHPLERRASHGEESEEGGQEENSQEEGQTVGRVPVAV
jgi:hypothetical protein